MILTKEKITKIDIDKLIESKILAKQINSVLIIVPTNRKLRDLKKKIISYFTDQPVSQINIETLTTFSTKLLKQEKSFIPLSEAAATVLIKETVSELNLNYFAKYKNGIPFGTLDKIKNVISEYKRHGISPENLLLEAEKLNEFEKKKAKDIAEIYKWYLLKCKNLSAFELGDIYLDLLKISGEKFYNYFKYLFPDVKTIIVNGFDEFTKPEIEILNVLSNIKETSVYINFDYFNSNNNLFSHLKDTYEKINEYGFKKITDLSPEDQNKFRRIVRSKLFADEDHIKSNKFKNNLIKVTPHNRIEEIEFIAQTIKLLVVNEKVQPEKICVAFNVIGNYSARIRYIFNKYGIPLNLTDRIPLKASQPVIAAVSLLELVEHDFYFHDIARVLTNQLIEFENINLNNLLIVANELKITSGINNWENIIDDAINLLAFNNEIELEELKDSKKRYLKAKSDIKKLTTLLNPFRKKITSAEFIVNFKKLLLNFKIPFKILENTNGKEEEYIKALTVLLQTLNEVLTLIDKNYENGNEPKHNLSFYLEQIRTITNWARFNVKEKSDYGVLVTSINEIRGLNFEYLFLGGMCDGDFPTKYSPEIFYSGSYQKKELVHQTEERYHFYQTLCAWSKNLYLIIPQKDNEKELVESTFIKDLEKLFLMKHVEPNYKNIILSKEELQILYGNNLYNEQIHNILKEQNISIEKINSFIEEKEKRINVKLTSEKQMGSDVSNFLNKYGEKQFSISQLETFAKCPFKFFAERILRIKPIEEPTEEAEPIELGNVLHSILFEFYSKVISDKLPVDIQGTSAFNNLQNLLFSIAEEKINKLNLHSPLAFFEKEKILGIDDKKENSILYKFLLSESENDSNYKPQLFEYGFGDFYNKNGNNIPPLKIENVKLRGKIDRIDVNESEKLYNVIDYKLKGKKPSDKDLKEGLSLQLPVYLMAGAHILKEITNDDYEGYKMIIFSLNYKDENFGPSPIKFGKRTFNYEIAKELNENLIIKTKEKISEYHQKIINGEFGLSTLEDRDTKVCSYCEFTSICRVKEDLSD